MALNGKDTSAKPILELLLAENTFAILCHLFEPHRIE